MELDVRQKQKTDTLANWGESSITLLKGEIGVIQTEDTPPRSYIKIGDGETATADLPYLSAVSPIVTISDTTANVTMSPGTVYRCESNMEELNINITTPAEDSPIESKYEIYFTAGANAPVVSFPDTVEFGSPAYFANDTAFKVEIQYMNENCQYGKITPLNAEAFSWQEVANTTIAENTSYWHVSNLALRAAAINFVVTPNIEVNQRLQIYSVNQSWRGFVSWINTNLSANSTGYWTYDTQSMKGAECQLGYNQPYTWVSGSASTERLFVSGSALNSLNVITDLTFYVETGNIPIGTEIRIYGKKY